MRCAAFDKSCVFKNDVIDWITVASITAATSGISLALSCLLSTRLTNGLTTNGSVRPATRLMATSNRPSSSSHFRGRTSLQISGIALRKSVFFFCWSVPARVPPPRGERSARIPIPIPPRIVPIDYS